MTFVNAVGTKLRFLHPETLPRFFGQLVARVKQLSTDRRQLAKALFFASANWLFDAASLFVFLGAFGRWVDPVALLVAYGVANIAAAIPFTPGGLGVLELTLIGILVGFGPPRAIVILGRRCLEACQLLAAHPRRRYQLPIAPCPPAGGQPGWPGGAEGLVAGPLALGHRAVRQGDAGPGALPEPVDHRQGRGAARCPARHRVTAPVPGADRSSRHAPLARAPRSPRTPHRARRRPPDRALSALAPAVPVAGSPPAPAATLVRTPGPIPPGRSGASYRTQEHRTNRSGPIPSSQMSAPSWRADCRGGQ